MPVNIKKNISLVSLSTFKIGNKARFFCKIKNDEELLIAITEAKRLKIPYKIIAGGSNIVFPDNFLNCFLIKIKSDKVKIFKNKIIADAGAALMRLIKKAIQNGFSGLEALSGIPGTLGGAIVGNAGAYGHSISEMIEKVEIWDGKKKRWLNNKDCDFNYRESIFKEKPYIVLRAVLKSEKGDPKKLQKISQNIIKTRLKKYKLGLRCPGSFFKNILVAEISKKSLKLINKNKIIDGKIPAGYLLEQVGAKGMRFGGIKIADFHGNLFINQGEATAEDVRKSARILKNKVYRKFGISLEEEVRYF